MWRSFDMEEMKKSTYALNSFDGAENDDQYLLVVKNLKKYFPIKSSFFKKTSFREFCIRNEEIHQGLNLIYDRKTYRQELVFPEGFKRKEHGICYRTMKNFEERFPEVAKEYFDLRYEDVKRYKVR